VLVFGSYAKRETVSGELVPDVGFVRVLAPQPGVVARRIVEEGQHVHAGQILVILSNDRSTSSGGAVLASINAHIHAQIMAQKAALDTMRRLHSREAQQIGVQVLDLERQESLLAMEVATQSKRVEYAKQTLARFENLSKDGFLPLTQVARYHDDALEQQAKLQALERQRQEAVASLRQRKADLINLPDKHNLEIEAITRSIGTSEQQLLESEAKREISVLAPVAGVATAVLADVGSTVGTSTTLLSIVPKDSKLVAHIAIPNRSIASVRQGQEVLLRYHAFPFQKFGVHSVRIRDITILPLSEDKGTAGSGVATGLKYRAIAELDYSGTSRGPDYRLLRAGMSFDADVLLERRRLFEWVFDPLTSFAQRL
jgi:membrane fusion protein